MASSWLKSMSSEFMLRPIAICFKLWRRHSAWVSVIASSAGNDTDYADDPTLQINWFWWSQFRLSIYLCLCVCVCVCVWKGLLKNQQEKGKYFVIKKAHRTVWIFFCFVLFIWIFLMLHVQLYNAECKARLYQVPFFESLVWLDPWLKPSLPGNALTIKPIYLMLWKCIILWFR